MTALTDHPAAVRLPQSRRGSPLRPRPGRVRQIAMTVVLLAITGVIVAYWHITDSTRVAAMAETYLSDALGARITIGRARLSIFQGLRLDDVKVAVDDSGDAEAVLFKARTFLLKYSPSALLEGRIEARQIVAVDPHLRLCENLDQGTWNYQRLSPRRRAPSPSAATARPTVLPTILLRNGRIESAQVRDAAFHSLGSLRVEGQLLPVGRYEYLLSARSHRLAAGEAAANAVEGPSIRGQINTQDRRVDVRLRNLRFDDTARAMLPQQVQDFCANHQLAGLIDEIHARYDPNTSAAGHDFAVRIAFEAVTLAIPPSVWMGPREHELLEAQRAAFDAMRFAGFDGMGRVARLEQMLEPAPLALKGVGGVFHFAPNGIRIENLRGEFEGNRIRVDGQWLGYGQDAPGWFTLWADPLVIPPDPVHVHSTPEVVRDLYAKLKPVGKAIARIDFSRAAKQQPVVSGEVNIIDGSFCFEDFPYPPRRVKGWVTFGPNKADVREDRVDFALTGRGAAGTPNADGFLTVTGFLCPLKKYNEVKVSVEARGVWMDSTLRDSLPHGVQEAIDLFGPTDVARKRLQAGRDEEPKGQRPPEYDQWPRMHGDFSATYHRLRGPDKTTFIDVNLHIDQASGCFLPFPYPMEQISGLLRIHKNDLEIVDLKMRSGTGQATLSGKVMYPKGKPVAVNLQVQASDVPIDEHLLGALPLEARGWMQRLGAGGRLDIRGRVFGEDRRDEQGRYGIRYDLDIDLKDGVLWPMDGVHTVTQAVASLHLTDTQLDIRKGQARRGKAQLSATGAIGFLADAPELSIEVQARGLELDSTLYRMLPQDTAQMWDEVRPEGTADVDLKWRGVVESGTAPATRPASEFDLVARPVNLAITPQSVPYRLEQLTGELHVHRKRVEVRNATGRHGKGTVALAVTGPAGGRDPWEFNISGRNLAIDEELLAAMPDSLAEMCRTVELTGTLSFDCPKLVYRPQGPPSPRLAQAATRPSTRSTTRPAEYAMDFDATLNFSGASMDVGVPLTDIQGTLAIAGRMVNGELAEATGRIDAPSLLLAGRQVADLKADLVKPPDRDAMQLGRMQARFAGGSLAGQIDLGFPRRGPTLYALSAVLRNADVQQLTGDNEGGPTGQASLSLALEGTGGPNPTRRGRGDMLTTGKNLYDIPLVLGLMEITNLTLPIRTPYEQAVTSYSVEGQKVTFENIELRGDKTMMKGEGQMDFAARTFKLSFVTDSVAWLRVPVLHELLKGARQELLRIHVTGSIREPRVELRSMHTFTTTIDRVFTGKPGD